MPHVKQAPTAGRFQPNGPLSAKKNFFDLYFIGSVSFDDHLTDSSLAVSCLLQSALVLVVQLAYTNKV